MFPLPILLAAVPSVLWRCWLGRRKRIRLVKNRVVGCWHCYLSVEQDADMHMAQLMPLPLTVSYFSKIQIGFTFLVPAHRGSPGKRAVKQVCVCVCRCHLGQLGTCIIKCKAVYVLTICEMCSSRPHSYAMHAIQPNNIWNSYQKGQSWDQAQL